SSVPYHTEDCILYTIHPSSLYIGSGLFIDKKSCKLILHGTIHKRYGMVQSEQKWSASNKLILRVELLNTVSVSITSMEKDSERRFFNFSFFKIDLKWRWMNDATKQESAKEFISIMNSANGVQYRSYSTLGLREDADFLLWFISDSLDKTQDVIAKLYTTVLGKYLIPSYNYLSATRPSPYSSGAVPSIVKGEQPSHYAIVYPFIKSREWYLLPLEDRKKMMSEHIMVGKKFPTVRLNTSYSFGLDDQDFMLAFETDDLPAFQDLIMQLRETQVSRYIVKDTPMIVCVYKPLDQVIKSLG
ncbi:MAG: chlorite dismutase family protein, partial [Nitrososphaerales archaeon]